MGKMSHGVAITLEVNYNVTCYLPMKLSEPWPMMFSKSEMLAIYPALFVFAEAGFNILVLI